MIEYVPDPIERIEAFLEKEVDKVTVDGKYPCCMCGKLTDISDISPVSPSPYAAGACFECLHPTIT